MKILWDSGGLLEPIPMWAMPVLTSSRSLSPPITRQYISVIEILAAWAAYPSYMTLQENLKSMKLAIPLHSLYWSIHTKDESKRGTAFAFIFGVNWLWRCGVTASFGIFFSWNECNGMTSLMEFMWRGVFILSWPSYGWPAFGASNSMNRLGNFTHGSMEQSGLYFHWILSFMKF